MLFALTALILVLILILRFFRCRNVRGSCRGCPFAGECARAKKNG